MRHQRLLALTIAAAVAGCTGGSLFHRNTQKTLAGYGTWESPLEAEDVAADAIRLEQVELDGDDVYWIEGRPEEKGRNVIVRRNAKGKIEDVTPRGFNARTRVHEYGGGSYAVRDGTVYFSNFSDNRLYRHPRGGKPQALTLSDSMRYADCMIDAARKRLVCVREDHSGSDRQAVNTIVTIPIDEGGDGHVLASGADFYSNPRLSPDGKQLAWLQWNHPDMPWDGTELWVASIAQKAKPKPKSKPKGKSKSRGKKPVAAAATVIAVAAPEPLILKDKKRVAGSASESIFQPQWSPDGVLHYVSDRSGWWNLYRWSKGKSVALAPMQAEFADAQWNFGYSTYAFADAGRIVCSYTVDGRWHLATIGADGALNTLELAYAPHLFVRADAAQAVFLGTAPTAADAIVRVDLADRSAKVLHAASEHAPDPALTSVAEPIEFPTAMGRSAHAFYYAPRNPDYGVAQIERPPLIVIGHGGPTSTAHDSYNPKIQVPGPRAGSRWSTSTTAAAPATGANTASA